MAKSKYNAETFPTLLYSYLQKGLNDKQCAENFGISQETFYQYMKRYPEFTEAHKKGKETKVTNIENALHKKAIGYYYDEITTEMKKNKEDIIIEKKVKKTKRHVPSSEVAAIFLLTNLNNKKYKRNPDLVAEQPQNNQSKLDEILENQRRIDTELKK